MWLRGEDVGPHPEDPRKLAAPAPTDVDLMCIGIERTSEGHAQMIPKNKRHRIHKKKIIDSDDIDVDFEEAASKLTMELEDPLLQVASTREAIEEDVLPSAPDEQQMEVLEDIWLKAGEMDVEDANLIDDGYNRKKNKKRKKKSQYPYDKIKVPKSVQRIKTKPPVKREVKEETESRASPEEGAEVETSFDLQEEEQIPAQSEIGFKVLDVSDLSVQRMLTAGCVTLPTYTKKSPEMTNIKKEESTSLCTPETGEKCPVLQPVPQVPMKIELEGPKLDKTKELMKVRKNLLKTPVLQIPSSETSAEERIMPSLEPVSNTFPTEDLPRINYSAPSISAGLRRDQPHQNLFHSNLFQRNSNQFLKNQKGPTSFWQVEGRNFPFSVDPNLNFRALVETTAAQEPIKINVVPEFRHSNPVVHNVAQNSPVALNLGLKSQTESTQVIMHSTTNPVKSLPFPKSINSGSPRKQAAPRKLQVVEPNSDDEDEEVQIILSKSSSQEPSGLPKTVITRKEIGVYEVSKAPRHVKPLQSSKVKSEVSIEVKSTEVRCLEPKEESDCELIGSSRSPYRHIQKMIFPNVPEHEVLQTFNQYWSSFIPHCAICTAFALAEHKGSKPMSSTWYKSKPVNLPKTSPIWVSYFTNFN